MKRLTGALLAALALASCNCKPPSGADAGGDSGGGGGAGGGGGGGGGGAGGGGGGGADQDAGCGLVTCATANANCGPVGDGCGGLLNCGSCTAPQSCGGGGVPSRCGGDGGCPAKTCAQIGANCGPVGDGCGGLLNCGGCTSPQTCGGGGINNRCGTSGGGLVDGGCVPRTCAQAGADCGPAGDGCGGLLNCGSCTSPQTCGGGGTPSVCGAPPSCVPKTCAQFGANCGPVGDGCGNLLNCGSCTSPQTCGGGGTPSVCGGGGACVPQTCAQLGKNCGAVGNGCGGLIDGGCGSCAAPNICGGGGTANLCGNNVPDAGSCVNLCLQQVKCDAGSTTISGTVVAPTDPSLGYGQPDPVYGALVYIPNAPVKAFDAGVSCDKCGAGATGSPLVSVVTGVNGQFALQNAPCGSNIPLVIQLGKWRRQITIPSVACCANSALTTAQTRLPRNQSEGDIPLIAVVTGSADPFECTLPKIGISLSEYTLPSGNGRVRFYRDNGSNLGASTPAASTLWGSQAELNKYDMIIADCVGLEDPQSPADQQRVINYLNAGGRLFATHYSYVWLYNVSPLSGTATWNVDQAFPPNNSAYVDQTFPKGQAFAQWLFNVGASTTLGRVQVNAVRHDFDAVIPPAQRWIYSDPAVRANNPIEYTFNCPVGADAGDQCGRVLYSDFHVATGSGTGTFPGNCGAAAPMTPQQKALEFMIFDLTSCIVPDTASPTCPPKSCSQQGYDCGLQGDGCGGVINCGSCTAPQTCGGGGVPGVCGGSSCTPRTCAQLGYNCGLAGDGCGGSINCGTCTAPQTCGGGGTPNVCGAPTCTPTTCAALSFDCGPAGDGCGGTLQCGACTPPQVCGGGGPGKCGAGCQPQTCASQNLSCGPAGDGCGGTLDCGTCTPPDTCGGGGTPGVCGRPACTPRTCADVGANCGFIADGCGGSVDCGPCVAPQTCGGGGIPNVCGGIG
ncbi:MAG: hypothetical protein HYZ28_20515 [Myxococcales bacterium]|nr:hypothetical protein [Myxococcales bacterium]